jgi:high affinity sulfate transporter 1
MDWLRGYRRDWLLPDALAGLSTAAVVIPKAMAYATIAGLPVEVGLYTALVPMAIYAVIGSSRPLSVSTTTTIAILASTQLSAAAPAGDPAALLAASATLALLVGAVLVLASALRLGFVANFISEPVLTGFKSGIGLVIVVDQFPKLLGIHIERGRFLENVASTLGALPETSGPTLLVTAATLAAIFGLERFAPRLPAPLLAVAAGIAASALLGLEGAGVSIIGPVSGGLPAPSWPELSLVESMWPGAVGIALMSFTETIAAGRAFAARGEPRLEPNRELLALGAANLAGGWLGAMPAGGGTSQTAVNRRAGARTQVAELVTASATLTTLILLAPLIAPMPQATLAAVVVAYSLDLMQPAEFRAIRRVRRVEFRWALIAFAGVVALGTLRGIVVAVIASVLSLAQQTNNPPVYVLGRKRGTNVFRPISSEHPDDETFPGLLLLRVEGRVFFANAHRVGEKMRPLIEAASPEVVVLDCGALTDLEYTALRMLTDAEERLRDQKVTVWLAGLNPEVLEVVNRSDLGTTLGRERMCFNLEDAVQRFRRRAGAAGASVPA